MDFKKICPRHVPLIAAGFSLVLLESGCETRADRRPDDPSTESSASIDTPLAERLAETEVAPELAPATAMFGDPTGSAPFRLEGYDVSPDGTTLAAVEDDKRLYVWDLENRELVRDFKLRLSSAGNHLPDVPASHVRFAPDGKHVFIEFTEADTERGESQFGVWSVDEPESGWKELGEHDYEVGRLQFVESMAFLPETSRLVTLGSDATLRFWDIETGRQVGSVSDMVGNFTLSQDRKHLWITGGTHQVFIDGPGGSWGMGGEEFEPAKVDLDTKTVTRLDPPKDACDPRRFSPNGAYVLDHCYAYKPGEPKFVVRERETGRELLVVDAPEQIDDVFARRATFSKDSRRLEVRVGAGVEVYHIDSGRRVEHLKPLGEPAIEHGDCQFGPTRAALDRTRLVAALKPASHWTRSGRCEGRFRVWSKAPFVEPFEVRANTTPPPIVALDFDPRPERRRERLAATRQDGIIDVWGLEEGKRLSRVDGAAQYADRTIREVGFLGDKRLMVVSDDRQQPVHAFRVDLWRLDAETLKTPEAQWAFNPQNDDLGPYDWAYDAASGRLAAAYEHNVVIFEAASGEQTARWKIEEFTPYALKFDTSGRRLVAKRHETQMETKLAVYDLQTGNSDSFGVSGHAYSTEMSPDLGWLVVDATDENYTLEAVGAPDPATFSVPRLPHSHAHNPQFAAHRAFFFDHNRPDGACTFGGTIVDLRSPSGPYRRWKLERGAGGLFRVSPDGSVLAVGMNDGSVAVYRFDKLTAGAP